MLKHTQRVGGANGSIWLVLLSPMCLICAAEITQISFQRPTNTFEMTHRYPANSLKHLKHNPCKNIEKQSPGNCFEPIFGLNLIPLLESI